MKKKNQHILTQQSDSSLNQPKQSLEKNTFTTTSPEPKQKQQIPSSNPQFPHKSVHIINDNFVNKLNPKRSSIDLTSFIQVFRKKIRQTTIARQFQNSIEKFKSISENRVSSHSRQKGGFVGSYKKQNQLLVENNRIDNKIKKIIISDLEFKERKIKPKVNFGQHFSLDKQQSSQNYECFSRDKSSRFSRRKILKYAQSQENDDAESYTVSFSNGMYSPQKFKDNPEHLTQTMKIKSDYTPTLYHEKEKESPESQEKKKTLFQNRRLETITFYQRPNLMYNLSLYRKKQSYNALKGTKKRVFHTQTAADPQK